MRPRPSSPYCILAVLMVKVTMVMRRMGSRWHQGQRWDDGGVMLLLRVRILITVMIMVMVGTTTMVV